MNESRLRDYIGGTRRVIRAELQGHLGNAKNKEAREAPHGWLLGFLLPTVHRLEASDKSGFLQQTVWFGFWLLRLKAEIRSRNKHALNLAV